VCCCLAYDAVSLFSVATEMISGPLFYSCEGGGGVTLGHPMLAEAVLNEGYAMRVLREGEAAWVAGCGLALF